MKGKCVFGIVGSGWRAEFYMRIAKALPELFNICGVVTRQDEKKATIHQNWGYKVYHTVDELINRCKPDFIVVSVNKKVAAGITEGLLKKGVPVLAETPPAADLQGLIQLNSLVKEGAKIQIAEQYHLQPMNAAILSVIQSRKLGIPNYTHVSFSHGYHAVSLIRKNLGVRFENAKIQAHEFTFPRIEGFGRTGLPEREIIKDNKHVFAFLDFGGKVGLYDFENNQHRSWARSQRIMTRGERGEVNNDCVKYLKDYKIPIEYYLKRLQTGENNNLEGYFLRGILAGEEWVYRNPFAPVPFSDEEIAIATCLIKMRDYVAGGPEFYSLAQASQDQYLAMMIEKAVSTGEKVITQTQEWAF